MSTALWLGQVSEGVPADLETASRNTYPVSNDDPPAELPHAPEWNEVQTDHNGQLGFVNRQLASDWHEPEQYPPNWAAGATEPHNDLVNRTVATQGTAAAKELTGAQGHGTIAYAIGIEPTIRPGMELGNDYFAANDPAIQQTMTRETGVQPADFNRDDWAATAAYGKTSAREANQGSVSTGMYDQLLGR